MSVRGHRIAWQKCHVRTTTLQHRQVTCCDVLATVLCQATGNRRFSCLTRQSSNRLQRTRHPARTPFRMLRCLATLGVHTTFIVSCADYGQTYRTCVLFSGPATSCIVGLRQNQYVLPNVQELYAGKHRHGLEIFCKYQNPIKSIYEIEIIFTISCVLFLLHCCLIYSVSIIINGRFVCLSCCTSADHGNDTARQLITWYDEFRFGFRLNLFAVPLLHDRNWLKTGRVLWSFASYLGPHWPLSH